jgi:hypothetical protein
MQVLQSMLKLIGFSWKVLYMLMGTLTRPKDMNPLQTALFPATRMLCFSALTAFDFFLPGMELLLLHPF